MGLVLAAFLLVGFVVISERVTHVEVAAAVKATTSAETVLADEPLALDEIVFGEKDVVEADRVQIASLSTSSLVAGVLSTAKAAYAAYFTVDPEFGQAPLTVTFDGTGSTTDSDSGAIVSYTWNFDVNNVGAYPNRIQSGPASTHAIRTFEYTEPGSYTVSLQVRYANAMPGGADRTSTYPYPGTIQVLDEEEEEEIATATLTVDCAMDGPYGLLPLNDWVGLFTVNMKWDSEDEPAPRVLASLDYMITGYRGTG